MDAKWSADRCEHRTMIVSRASIRALKEQARKAGLDNRIGATVPGAITAMKAAGKIYEPVTYEGAGHGFMRMGEQPDATPANVKAREEAWKRLKEILAHK